MEWTLKCQSCGHEPEKDQGQSSENWDVYDSTCPECGGDVIPDLKGGEKDGHKPSN